MSTFTRKYPKGCVLCHSVLKRRNVAQERGRQKFQPVKLDLAVFCGAVWYIGVCVFLMSAGYDFNAGLWQYISQHSPAPERDEIAQIIGRSLINRNAVWEL